VSSISCSAARLARGGGCRGGRAVAYPRAMVVRSMAERAPRRLGCRPGVLRRGRPAGPQPDEATAPRPCAADHSRHETASVPTSQRLRWARQRVGLAPPHARSLAFGAVTALQNAGRLLASIVAGVLWTVVAPEARIRLDGSAARAASAG